MCPKDFVIMFYIFVYTLDIPTIGSRSRDNMCFVFT